MQQLKWKQIVAIVNPEITALFGKDFVLFSVRSTGHPVRPVGKTAKDITGILDYSGSGQSGSLINTRRIVGKLSTDI